MAKSDQKKAAALAALMECDTFTEAAEKAQISRKNAIQLSDRGSGVCKSSQSHAGAPDD